MSISRVRSDPFNVNGKVSQAPPGAPPSDGSFEEPDYGLTRYICEVVDAAPPLSAAQRDRLASLVRGTALGDA